MKDELGETTKVIATGGLANVVAQHSNSIDEVLPMLTLEGLLIIHEASK